MAESAVLSSQGAILRTVREECARANRAGVSVSAIHRARSPERCNMQTATTVRKPSTGPPASRPPKVLQILCSFSAYPQQSNRHRRFYCRPFLSRRRFFCTRLPDRRGAREFCALLALILNNPIHIAVFYCAHFGAADPLSSRHQVFEELFRVDGLGQQVKMMALAAGFGQKVGGGCLA